MLSKLKLSVLIICLSILFSWWYIFFVENASFLEILSQNNLDFLANFIQNLIGIGQDSPAFFNRESWIEALLRVWDTLIMSIIATVMAMVGVLLCMFPGMYHLTTTSRSFINQWTHRGLQVIFTLTRAIPELLWASILIFIMQPGIFTGALALAINHFGTLGKITFNQMEQLNKKQILNIQSTGAKPSQILLYAVIPVIIPKFLGNVFYRWEEIIRASIVVGFVGTGGLGQGLQLAMSWRNFTVVTLYLICYISLVYLIDSISQQAKNYVLNHH